ncbi:MAG TPA: FAD:protein FMN transferase, partial [Flavitalea sp.]|nr:FAD:protein FMN transferase [Flavitalea sp.]
MAIEVSSKSREFRRSVKLMGNTFEITIVADATDFANQQINFAIAEIQRIESLLTTFDDKSETNLINRYAGRSPVKVSPEVYNLIERSLRISSITDGAFDITYGSLDKSLWNFDK